MSAERAAAVPAADEFLAVDASDDGEHDVGEDANEAEPVVEYVSAATAPSPAAEDGDPDTVCQLSVCQSP